MRYSKEKQRFHLEKVYAVLSQDPARSAREVHRILEKENFHLSWMYVNKLVWKACDKLSEEVRNQTLKTPLITEWHEELLKIVNEFNEKVREHIWGYPGKLDFKIDPHEDIWQ